MKLAARLPPLPEILRWGLATALALASLAASAYVFLIFDDVMLHKPLGGDEGYFVWCGWCVTKGLAPYRDFIEFKPPLLFLTHALALKLHGFSELHFRRFFVYFPMGSLLALQIALLTRRIDKWLAMGLVVALMQVWVNPRFHDTGLSDSESIGLSYYFLGVAFLLARTPWPRAQAVLGAALLFCAAQSKEPFTPCVICTWLGCFLAGERRLGWRKDLTAYTKLTALGAGIVAVALLLYLAPTGALREYVAIVRRYSVVYRDARQSFCVLGGVFQPTTPGNDFVRQWYRLRADYLNLATLGFLVPFAVAAVLFTWRRSWLLFLTTAAGVVGAYLAVTASNCPWLHYDNMLLSGLFFFLIIGLDSMSPYLHAAERSTGILVRVAMLTSIGLAVFPRIESERAAYATVHPPTQSDFDRVPGSFDAIRKYTVPGDRIFTTGNPILYVQMDRVSALRESNLLDPILSFYVGETDAEKLRPLYDELVLHRPKIVVLDPEFSSVKVRHTAAAFGPFLDTFHYKKLSETIYLRPE